MSNRVREIRKQLMMSTAELAQKAGVSPLTIKRVEAGYQCRIVTKRKILDGLGMTVGERKEVFPEDDE